LEERGKEQENVNMKNDEKSNKAKIKRKKETKGR
jgi:hypothetical protein